MRFNATGLCVLVLSLCGCVHPDYEKTLVNGYVLVRANSSEIFISNKERVVVVPGRITELGYVRDAIFGVVEIPYRQEPTKRSDFPDVVEGYFLIDTTRNVVELGLSKSALSGQLNKMHVDSMTLERVD